MTWKRGINSEVKMFQNGNKIFEDTVTVNPIQDLQNSGRSVYDIGKVLTQGTEETAHAYLSDLVAFNRELPEHELKEEWVHNHTLYKFI